MCSKTLSGKSGAASLPPLTLFGRFVPEFGLIPSGRMWSGRAVLPQRGLPALRAMGGGRGVWQAPAHHHYL